MKYKVGDRFSGINSGDLSFVGMIVEINPTASGGPYQIIWSDVAEGKTPVAFSERELDHIIGTESIVHIPKPKPLPEDLFVI